MGAGRFLKYNTFTAPPPAPTANKIIPRTPYPGKVFLDSRMRVSLESPPPPLLWKKERGGDTMTKVTWIYAMKCPFYCKKRAVLIFFLCKDHLRLINSLYESPKKTYFLNQHFPMYPFNTQIIVIFNLFARSEEQQILPYKNVVYILGTTIRIWKSVCMQSVLSMYLHVGFNWSRSYAT